MELTNKVYDLGLRKRCLYCRKHAIIKGQKLITAKKHKIILAFHISMQKSNTFCCFCD